jgi:hypothetical protein
MTKVGTTINTAVYLHEGQFYWVRQPDGMTREAAFDTQQHYGPFETEAEVHESQRIVLFGEQCEVTPGAPTSSTAQ